jgi:Siphovirus Gp157
MSLKLADFITHASQIEKSLIESGGEISPELERELLIIDLTKREAVDSVQTTLERLEVMSDYWATKAENYAKIAKSLSFAQQKLKNYVKSLMAASGDAELTGLDWRLKLCPSKAKMVLNEDELAKEYFKEKVTMVPDKTRIEEDLKLGVPVPGAALEPVFTLRVYPNKKEIA